MLETIKDILGIDRSRYDIEEQYGEEDYPDSDGVDNSFDPAPVVENSETAPAETPSRKFSVRKEGKMNGSGSKVIGMPGIANNNSEVLVIEPHSFEEMPKVIKALRERKSVVLNLNMMNPEQAQRAVDFVAGGTFAMDGHQERVGESIFLFTPSCVKVSSLTGVIHDVQQPETYTRRSAPVTETWVEPNAVAQ
jgi:cell division inhibitor SepF